MAVAAVTVVSGIPFGTCYEIIDRIRDAISIAKENDDRCNHIFGQMSVIKSSLEELEGLSKIDALREAIGFVHQKLTKCDDYMNEMRDRTFSRPRDFLEGRKNGRTLMLLSNEIDSALTTLNTAIGTQTLVQQQGGNHSSALKHRKTTSIPGKPTKLSVPKRAEDRIKLSWSPPDGNATAVSHYVVQYRRRWGKWEEYKCTDNAQLQLVVDGLSSDTKYWFRVRAVNSESYKGPFSEEIPTETKFRRLTRGLITAGAAIGGTLLTPIAYPAAAIAGTVAMAKEDRKGMAAGVAVATKVSTPISPILMGAATAVGVHEDLAPDSFDDEDEDN